MWYKKREAWGARRKKAIIQEGWERLVDKGNKREEEEF